MQMNDSLNTLQEPVFYTGLQEISQVLDYLESTPLFNYFEYRLKQNPKDLLCHIQRIQYARSEIKIANLKKEGHQLFTALCDLFLVLGTLGFPLRKRLLGQNKQYLNQEHIKLLNEFLVNNTIHNEQDLLPDNCFFKKNDINNIKTYSSSKSEAPKLEDIIKTIDSYIENTQLDSALEYMNKHLEKDQDNEALTIKLIGLYKALYHEDRYADEFNTAYEKFSNNLLTSKLWDDTNQSLLCNEGAIK